MINCENVRSVKIRVINSDNSISTNTIYIDITTQSVLDEADVRGCENIQPLTINCASDCD